MRSGRADPYRSIRPLLAAELREASPRVLRRRLSIEAAEDLGAVGNAFQSFARAAAPVMQRALPGAVQGAATGLVAGGPVGALVGGIGGGALGALGGAAGTSATSRNDRGARGAGAPAHGGEEPTSGDASAAAAVLLSLMANPRVVQALLAMMLGRAGAATISVAGAPVPPGAFTNLLGTLAQQASLEHHRIARRTDEVPEYLVDASGRPRCDPLEPAQRAEVLLDLLRREAEVSLAERDVDDPPEVVEADVDWDLDAFAGAELAIDAGLRAGLGL